MNTNNNRNQSHVFEGPFNDLNHSSNQTVAKQQLAGQRLNHRYKPHQASSSVVATSDIAGRSINTLCPLHNNQVLAQSFASSSSSSSEDELEGEGESVRNDLQVGGSTGPLLSLCNHDSSADCSPTGIRLIKHCAIHGDSSKFHKTPNKGSKLMKTVATSKQNRHKQPKLSLNNQELCTNTNNCTQVMDHSRSRDRHKIASETHSQLQATTATGPLVVNRHKEECNENYAQLNHRLDNIVLATNRSQDHVNSHDKYNKPNKNLNPIVPRRNEHNERAHRSSRPQKLQPTLMEQAYPCRNNNTMNQLTVHKSTNIIKFISQLYFLIHLAVILAILLHHRILIANERFTSQPNVLDNYKNSNQTFDYRLRRTAQSGLVNLNESSTTQNTPYDNDNFQNQQSIATSNDILVRLIGYSHARKSLYYLLAYLLTTSAIILLMIRLIRYINTHHNGTNQNTIGEQNFSRQYHSILRNSYPYFGLEFSKSSFYHRIRLDCTPVLIACIALGLFQLANIGYNVANKIDLFAKESRCPIYLSAIHFCFVSLLTQYILGWVTTKHEQKRLIKTLERKQQHQQREQSRARSCKIGSGRLVRAKAINQAADATVIATAAQAAASPAQTCSSSFEEYEDDDDGTGAINEDHPMGQENDIRSLAIDNRNNRHQRHRQSRCTMSFDQQDQQLRQRENHPIRLGLHNIALAHILVTHLLLWLIDLNSIDLLQLAADQPKHNINEHQTTTRQENHKVIYTVNYPASPKKTSSRSLSKSQLFLDESIPINGMPIPVSIPPTLKPHTTLQPQLTSTHLNASTAEDNGQLIKDYNAKMTTPKATTTSATNELWTPSDELRLNPPLVTSVLPTPTTPAIPIQPTPAHDSSFTPPTSQKPAISTTTSQPKTPPPTTTTTTPVHQPELIGTRYAPEPNKNPPYQSQSGPNDNEDESLPKQTLVEKANAINDDQNNENSGDENSARDQPNNSKSRLPSPSNTQFEPRASDKKSQRNRPVPTTPPGPMNWDSASENTPRHELGDSGHLAPPVDLSQVLPARKRRVQYSTNYDPGKSQIVEQTQAIAPDPGKPASKVEVQQQTTNKPAPPTKRKTAFRPFMTSRHINLTTNKPSNQNNQNTRQLVSSERSMTHNNYNNNNQESLANSPERKFPAKLDSSQIVSSNEARINQAPRRYAPKRPAVNGERPFPSLETSEPAAWPSNLGSSRASNSAEAKNPRDAKQNQPTETKKRRNSATLNNKIQGNVAGQETVDDNEIANVIPVSQIRALQARRERAMRNQNEQTEGVNQFKQTTTTPSPNSELVDGPETSQSNLDDNSNDDDKSQVDSDYNDVQSDNSLDSQLPPVPNYDQINAGNDSTMQDTTGGETGEGGNEDNSENDEQLQQLNLFPAIESRRLTPMSQPLISNLNQTMDTNWGSNGDAMTRLINQDLLTTSINNGSHANQPSSTLVDYLRCIVGQFYILLAALLLNLWLDGLSLIKTPQHNPLLKSHPEMKLARRKNMSPKQLYMEHSPASEIGPVRGQLYSHQSTNDLRETGIDSPSWSSPSLTSSSQTDYIGADDLQPRFLLNRRVNAGKDHKLRPSRKLVSGPIKSSIVYNSKGSQHLTACSLFAGLCIVASAIASIMIGVELISILTQCLTQFCTILACLIGLCLIWRCDRKRYGHQSLQESLNFEDFRGIPSASSNRRLWQYKSSVYLEPSRQVFWKPQNQHRSIPIAISASQLQHPTTSKATTGRQFFHYLFLLAAYYTGISIALNLGAQYSIQQVFPQHVILFISGFQQRPQEVNLSHQTILNHGPHKSQFQSNQIPVSISQFNLLFQCVLGLKGLLLIVQVTIQTVLIRCSCKIEHGNNGLRHIYSFLMFANLSLWAIEISSFQKQSGGSIKNEVVNQREIQPTTLINESSPDDSYNNTATNMYASHLFAQQEHLVSLESFLSFASSMAINKHGQYNS